MDAARFSPTWRQSVARGAYLGVLAAGPAVAVALLVLVWGSAGPPVWLWVVLTVGPPGTGVLIGVLLGPRLGTEVDAGGIRTVTPFSAGTEPWSRVVDLRAERRGSRTVVSVYLDSGVSVRLRAPYSGELFAADPRFEQKLSALGHLVRSHRIGGLPG